MAQMTININSLQRIPNSASDMVANNGKYRNVKYPKIALVTSEAPKYLRDQLLIIK